MISYQIQITKFETREGSRIYRHWYGIPTTTTEETVNSLTVYDQRVDELNIPKVIAAINTP